MKLPQFRKRPWINGEGWALYGETQGHEMGFYDDPAVYTGTLRLEMARAARIVVDTGVHAPGMEPRRRSTTGWRTSVRQKRRRAASSTATLPGPRRRAATSSAHSRSETSRAREAVAG